MKGDEDRLPRNLEAVLGPSQGRFFGKGYRGVRHELLLASSHRQDGSFARLAACDVPC